VIKLKDTNLKIQSRKYKHSTQYYSNLQENLARNWNSNGKSAANLHSSQDMNHENTQNSTIVIDGPCASNDPEESQTPDQNNMDIEITATPNKPSTSTQNLTTKPNNESPILIIGDSIIKHIDPRKISKRRVIKRTFPGKTANDIKAEIKSIKVDSPPSHIIVHAGTNDIPVDLDNNCIKSIKNIWSLASSIKERFPGSKIGISSIAVRDDADLTDQISTVNKQLQELCVKNGFDFINNSSVDNTCLNGSQLHLNAKGFAFLATNFIKFLRRSNANVKSSYRSRRNEDFRRTRPARFHLLEDLLRLMSIS
jgi:lysophospholipase L1-like esterase